MEDEDLDVCVTCGTYYLLSPHMVKKWKAVWSSGPMAQLCHVCLNKMTKGLISLDRLDSF